jgi:hypothetical protein
MKKQVLLTLFFLSIGVFIWAQTTQILEDFNQSRMSHQRTAMYVLGSWAVGNIALGTTMQFFTTGEQKYFHQMNAGWNIVNLGIAGFALWSLRGQETGDVGLESSLSEYFTFQKVLLFNAGLDIGYMLGGLYMMERSRRPNINNPERLKGFGQSIILQGAFLFGFDLITYLTSTKISTSILPTLQINPGIGMQMGLQVSF